MVLRSAYTAAAGPAAIAVARPAARSARRAEGASARIDRDSGVGGGLIVSVRGGRIAGVSAALRELLIRHVDVGTIPGGVALLGAGNARAVTAGMASVGSGPMGEDAIMRIQSMTKAITSVAALRLAEAGHCGTCRHLPGRVTGLLAESGQIHHAHLRTQTATARRPSSSASIGPLAATVSRLPCGRCSAIASPA